MTHHTFASLRSHVIPALRLEVQEYRHRVTGARHIHLASDDDQNVFLVSFLTVPQDSTGVAHILEHTALCGSRRYPVRDPFFMMIRRSLNTFMNAFTASDWTAYPFATRNRKDFDNLLDVYLDAAFFPNLDPLDFAQEGHRLEFAEPSNPNSALEYRGVVYNEMKGAMSSPVQALAQRLQTELFPTITYHHNSGGEPSCIPELTHEQLKAFHARHYHPSNAVFMTFGNIPAAEHQERFEQRVLSQFQPLAVDFSIPDEQRYSRAQTAQSSYALDGDEDPARKTHIVLGWLLGRNTDPQNVMRARILADALLDNSSSPLRRVLETSSLGEAPSPLCGFDDATRETTFVCGLEGSDPEHADAVEKLVLDTLAEVAADGIPQQTLEAVLHQLELSQREITGDGFPYGLQLMLTALTPAIHGGDPVAALDLDAVLAPLREEIKDPEFSKRLVRELLLDNPHRVRLTMAPDRGLSTRQAAQESERLARIKAALDGSQQQTIVAQAQALIQRQMREDDPEVLPKVGLEDIPAELDIATGESLQIAARPLDWYAQGTNGMVYQQIVVDLPALDEELLELLPLYTLFVTEVGSAGRDYLTTQSLQAAVTGGLSARYIIRGAVNDLSGMHATLAFSGKALVRNQQALGSLLQETFLSPRFDEYERLRELTAQTRAQREESVTDQGHILAMTAAAAALSPAAALTQRWSGLLGLQTLRGLDDSLADDAAVAAFGARLHDLHKRIQAAPSRFLLVGEQEQRGTLVETLDRLWCDAAGVPSEHSRFAAAVPSGTVQQGWAVSSQVNFCARCYPTVPPDHPDAPVLQVLGEYLRNGFLHRAIREQGGAYGAGAAYHGDSGGFRFFSYRDPRLAETLADFDRSLQWLQDAKHPSHLLEEAILGVIGAIDRPGSPAGEAMSAFFGSLFGRTPEQRRRFRRKVLAVTLDDLRRVAALYLRPERAHTAVIGNAGTLRRQSELEIISL